MNKLFDEYTTITMDEFLDWLYNPMTASCDLRLFHRILIGKYDLDVAREDILSFRKEI